jgi:hypothetical protein
MDRLDVHPVLVILLGGVTLNTVDLQVNRHVGRSPSVVVDCAWPGIGRSAGMSALFCLAAD